ncbi:6-hydroxy-D-nicotine oxidase [Apiospora rasikravindrae]|uniref:6-hydroxy-D-nicotine oxidase n=1 Tax=Apiospora rasikravindrae TaxID=990691 RepID=A0ABR1SKD9_9PEZI
MILAGYLVQNMALLLLASCFAASSTKVSSAATGADNCEALIAAAADLKDIVLLPTDPAYDASLTYYWSATVRDVKPSCFVQPRNTEEVARAIQFLSKTSGSDDVAIRSGGHSTWASNNVAGGVTIDLSLLNRVTYSEDTKIASIGTGAKWGTVMLEIEKYNRTATGGREGDVGVGGLLLGGGLSFLHKVCCSETMMIRVDSGIDPSATILEDGFQVIDTSCSKRGIASNDVVNFEVVLSNDSVIDANARTNPGFFKALKGGSNNFGIVTRFDMLTFEVTPGGIYGGLSSMAYDQKETVLSAFVKMIDINEENPADTGVLILEYNSPGPATITMAVVNIDGVENSTSFTPLQNVPFSLCFKNDIDIVNKAASLWEDLTSEAESAFPGEGWGLNSVFQPLAQFYGQIGSGQNVLGLDETLEHDSIIWLADATMSTPEQEAYLQRVMGCLTDTLEAYTAEKGGYTQWRYLNYVDPSQNPLKSYGKDNVRLMKEVAAQYDPVRFFQKRVSSGFKISKIDDDW